MATINLGAIKFNWKGAYNSGTSYAVDDVVSSGGNSYVCIQAHSNQAVGNATAYWNIMSSAGTNGTNGTDVGTTITTQGDILYRDGSGLQRLGAGTSGQYLETKGSGQNPVWSTVSSGNYSVHAFDSYAYKTIVSTTSRLDYVDIAGGNTVSFTPTSTNDVVAFTIGNTCYQGGANAGMDIYIKLGTSSTLGSSDESIGYGGQHNFYQSNGTYHLAIYKTFIYPCTNLTPNTTYYAEQAGGTHTQSPTVEWNYNNSGNNGDWDRHFVNIIHYKKN